MDELKEQIKELVAYILNQKERDEEVIESYTDTILDVCEEYHQSKLKNNGGLGGVVGQSEQLCQCEDASIKHFAKNWCDACQKHIV